MGAADPRRVVYFSHLLFHNLHAANHIFCQNTLSFHHKKNKEFIMSFSSAVRKSGIPSVLAGSWIYCRDINFISNCM